MSDNQLTRLLLPEGYTIRPATMDDLEAVVSLINAHSQAILGERVATVDTFRLEWESLGFDLETDTRVVVAPGGQLAGYMQVWYADEPRAHLWSWGRVHPDHKGQGIADYLFEWTEARARQFMSEGTGVVLFKRDIPRARTSLRPRAGLQPVVAQENLQGIELYL